MSDHRTQQAAGFTLIEMLITLAISSMLIVLISGIINGALLSRNIIQTQNDLIRQTRFAMQKMVQSVSQSRLLLVPMPDDPGTTFSENIRAQTIPPSPPPTGSTNATAVLAVTLPITVDLNADGFPDADNDKDHLIDEDLPNDMHNDNAAGIIGIDDDGEGGIDGAIVGGFIYLPYPSADDDESSILFVNEDSFNGSYKSGAGSDDDGDGNIDEDVAEDNNYDGCPGLCGIDDDGDGDIDEGSSSDDDEDGRINEDWYDPVVFYLSGDNLLQRTPVPWDIDASGTIDGRDYIEEVIASHVSHFRVERLIQGEDRSVTLDLLLELKSPLTDASFSLNQQVRVGGHL